MRSFGDDAESLRMLERLIGLDPEARDEALAALEQRAPDRAAWLRRMLDRSDVAESFFEGLETTIGRSLAAELDCAWAPGRVVGPYRLERLLGTGGMGAVFLARKADGELKRPVALKLVPPGLINTASVERFRQERDLLASLSHPNIAQLLDAGLGDDGQPWIAMEYIEGHDLLAWCRQHTSTVEQRVRLFQDLLSAVRFAHRNLVVHGDLKPANVRIDASGRLRLLDFGIARLFNELARDADRDAAARGYTPGYAAPELGAGGRTSVAGDVYALGVMLRELAALPASRPTRAPRGELEMIIARATRDDPGERYESARQLSEELGRWLALEPVAARGGGALYRFGKRLRRHPWASTGVALALAAVIGFGLYSRIQAERFAAQRDSARQLTAFMEQVFLGADPENARDGHLSARTLLDRGLAGLASGSPTSAPAREVRARFVSIMGRTYQRLGDYTTAQRLLTEALALGTLDPGEQIEVLLELADNHFLAGRFEQAEAAYREQLARSPNDAARARALAGLARTLAQTGRAGEAVELLDESIGLTRDDPTVASWRLAQRLNDAGSARFRLGEYSRAVELLEEALALRRQLDALDPERPAGPATATLINNLGLMHYLAGDPSRAEPALREALALRREVLAPDHPDLAQTLTNLGLMLKDYGDRQQATTLLREALAVRELALEPDHYRIAQSRLNLAIALREIASYDEAEPLLRESLQQLMEQLGDDHPQVAVAHTELGELWLLTGRFEQAEAAFRRSLEIRREALNEGHPHLAWSLLGLGRALMATGRRDDALPFLREAVAIRQAALPAENPLRLAAEAALHKAEAVSRRPGHE